MNYCNTGVKFMPSLLLLPPLLLASLSANVTIRSASPGPVYSSYLVHADSTTGSYAANTTQFVPTPTTSSYYLRLCNENISYYIAESKCTNHVPLPGQCQCLERNSSGACVQWDSFLTPDSIPSDAPYQGNTSSMNGYKNVNEWTYFFPPFASTISVWTVTVPGKMNESSFVTRTVGARVQTDYIDVIPGSPPPSSFSVPSACLRK